MHLSEKQRAEAFPVHIELGQTMGPPGVPMPVKEGGKPRKYYPSVYIDVMPGLEKLPKEGCMLVEFKRQRLTIEEDKDGEDTAGVTLELRRICLAEDAGEDDEDAPHDLESAMSQYGKKSAKKMENGPE
jgi:hypothetical protein